MKEIKLTQGKVALVSDEDYEWILARGKWQFDRYAYQTRPHNGKRRSIRMHRLIAEKMFGEIPKNLDVDHINKDKLDNCRDNIRLLTRSENLMNVNVKSKYRGVYWDKARGRWKSHVAGKDLGRFDTAEEAAEVSKRYIRENYKGVVCDE